MKVVVFGGNGLIGTKLVQKIRDKGIDVKSASRSAGIDTVTGSGLAEVLKGVDVVADVTNSHSLDESVLSAFFETSTRNLLAAEALAGTKHHVVLSVVGAVRLQESSYMRAKVLQEEIVQAGQIPFTIVRSTQFFEFVNTIAASSTNDTMIRLSPAMVQSISAADVAVLMAEIVANNPVNGVIEIAGPEAIQLDNFVRQYLAANRDHRQVITDIKARYFGALPDDYSLMPGNNSLPGTLRFSDWLTNVIPNYNP